MSIRPVKSQSGARPTLEGAGVKLHRVFGFGDTSTTDPFLMTVSYTHLTLPTILLV